MNTNAHAKTQTLCAWSGFVGANLFFGGLLIMGFIPPLLPSSNAADIAAIYQANTNGIRLGAILIMMAGGFVAPMFAAIAVQMKRIEGSEAPVLTYTQIITGAGGLFLFIVPAMVFTAAAFRPERTPEITQTINDLAWIITVMPFILGFMQNLSIGFCIIGDKRTQPIMPRWVGFLNIWIAILFVPGCLITFFKLGPFAWNGLIGFWLPALAFGPWFLVMPYFVSKAAKKQEAGG